MHTHPPTPNTHSATLLAGIAATSEAPRRKICLAPAETLVQLATQRAHLLLERVRYQFVEQLGAAVEWRLRPQREQPPQLRLPT